MLYKGMIIRPWARSEEKVNLEYHWKPKEIRRCDGKEFRNISEYESEALAIHLGKILGKLETKERFSISDTPEIKILDKEYKNFKNLLYHFDETDDVIIYEKVEDEDGNTYGREILTGALFPLDESGDKSIGFKEYEIQKASNFADGYGFILYIQQRYKHENFARIDRVLESGAVATPNEIEKYRNKFDTGNKRKKEAFTKRIIELSKKNTQIEEVEVFPVKPKKKGKKERESQNNITRVMENIEFLIQRLKKVKPEKAKEFSTKYESILNEKDFLNKSNISISSLVKLEAELEFELMFTKGENTSLVDKLEETKREYLSHFVTDSKEKTKISLDEIDKLMELFLKTKDNYSILEQRRILRGFASVYALEVKENESEVTPERLDDSYFADLKKSIMIFINALIENGYVKNNMIVEFSKEGTTEEVLNLIRSLEFNKLSKEQAQELRLTI